MVLAFRVWIEKAVAHAWESGSAVGDVVEVPRSDGWRTVAGDKGYDTKGFINDARQLGFTPHVAQNTSRYRRPAIDGRTTRHAGRRLSIGSAHASRNPSVGSRPSPAAKSSAT